MNVRTIAIGAVPAVDRRSHSEVGVSAIKADDARHAAAHPGSARGIGDLQLGEKIGVARFYDGVPEVDDRSSSEPC